MARTDCYRKYREFKDNSTCIFCDEHDRRKLQFHHFDPYWKFMGVAEMVRMGFDWGDVKDEIDKCVVVCETCHQSIHRKNPRLNQGYCTGPDVRP